MLMGVRDLLCHWVDPSFVLLFLCGVDGCERPVESYALFLWSLRVWQTYQVLCVVLFWMWGSCIVLPFLYKG